jgi:hypothetical protein
MHASHPRATSHRTLTAIAMTAMLGAGTIAAANDAPAMLSGAQEVPPVMTSASARADIVVGADRAVTGTVETHDIDGTVAHIHSGAVGTNGPVVVPLTQTQPGMWSVPAGTVFTPEQYARYMAGQLYVNVHSAAHPAGEIRVQLKP